jgi:hypothetical protein
MRKKDEDMRNDLIFIRINLDQEACSRLEKISKSYGRTKQRQIGIILENIADLLRSNPQTITDLKLLDPRPITSVAA